MVALWVTSYFTLLKSCLILNLTSSHWLSLCPHLSLLTQLCPVLCDASVYLKPQSSLCSMLCCLCSLPACLPEFLWDFLDRSLVVLIPFVVKFGYVWSPLGPYFVLGFASAPPMSLLFTCPLFCSLVSHPLNDPHSSRNWHFGIYLCFSSWEMSAYLLWKGLVVNLLCSELRKNLNKHQPNTNLSGTLDLSDPGSLTGEPLTHRESESDCSQLESDAWNYLDVWSLTAELEECSKLYSFTCRGWYFIYSFSYAKHIIIFKTVQIRGMVPLILTFKWGKRESNLILSDISSVWHHVPNLISLFWKEQFFK